VFNNVMKIVTEVVLPRLQTAAPWPRALVPRALRVKTVFVQMTLIAVKFNGISPAWLPATDVAAVVRLKAVPLASARSKSLCFVSMERW